MRRIFVFLCILVINIFNVYSQEKVYIPDANFRSYLNSYYSDVMDSSNDSLIIVEAAKKTGTIDCRSRGIVDLTGIEYFTGISQIYCHANDIEFIPDLSNVNSLTYLDCNTNNLTSIPKLPESVEFLAFSYNPIADFPDLSSYAALKILYFTNTNVTTVSDLSANTALEELYCYNNTNLTSLPDLSSNTNLIWLSCSYCSLTNLPNLPPSIQELECFGNDITSLPNLSACTNLRSLSCYLNNLTILPDLSANTSLTKLYCAYNNLTSLPDLSNLTELEVLSFYYNDVESIPDLSNLTKLKSLKCGGNYIKSLPDLSNNLLLEELNCGGNEITELPNLSLHNNLKSLYCSYNQLDTLPDLSENDKLEELQCRGNSFKQLPELLSTKLIMLDCCENELTSLPQLPITLTSLYCDDNLLQTLPDLSDLNNLTNLECKNNRIKYLPDMSNNKKLYSVYISNNKLDFSDAREIRIIDTLPELYYYSYNQSYFGERDTIIINEGNKLSMSIASQDSALSYQWYNDNIAIEDATDTLYEVGEASLEMAGTYVCFSFGKALSDSVMIHGSGIDYFISEPIEVVINDTSSVGINNQKKIDYKIYPNPTTGYVFIQAGDEVTYEIYDYLGQFLEKGTTNKINLDSYKEGYYFIKIINQNNLFDVKKILLIK